MEKVDAEFELFVERIKKGRELNIVNIRKSYEFAKKAHTGQLRQTGEPYITHPLEVAKIVYDYGLGEPSVIAALLHDVVEDTPIKLGEIKKNFGDEVELLVDGLSKINMFTESREEKSAEALRKILLASAKDIRVLIIKLCDRLHNLRTLEELPESKRERVARETMLIYAPIAQKIGIYSLKWELEDLSFKYRNPDMYQLIKSKINMKRKDREGIVQKAVVEIKEVLKMEGIDNILALGRPKNFFSIYKKVKDKAKSFEDLYDLYAVRIIAKDISECYTILGVLHDQFQAFPDKLKDYIANPKANGYQSIHTIVYSRSIKCPVEVQIRTEEMHKLAEFGIAAHWKYKNLKEDKKFEKKISWLREVLLWEKEHKDNSEFLHLLKYDFFQNEIFVFTPKNEIIFLPDGSSVLDFAYAVHTEIGDKAYKAKVNGAITTIDKTLKNGDIVEIITNKSAKPTDKWLKLVKTSKAKIKIRDSMNLKFKKTPDDKKEEVNFETLRSRLTRLNEFKKVRKGGCCNLNYGDHVVGVVGKNGELVVHNASCDNSKYTVSKKIPLNWIQERKKEIEIFMILKDRFGLLIDILNVFSDFNLNVSKLNTRIQKDGSVKMDLKVIDGPYMDKLVERLNGLESVENVRVSRGIFG
ncbi:MAG: RelA/SpoT family protein [Candidatus Woesearchaeota archaeon]|nr:RelA/SpoT family protein [Candidatus Woesearchaeota archaeon]